VHGLFGLMCGKTMSRSRHTYLSNHTPSSPNGAAYRWLRQAGAASSRWRGGGAGELRGGAGGWWPGGTTPGGRTRPVEKAVCFAYTRGADVATDRQRRTPHHEGHGAQRPTDVAWSRAVCRGQPSAGL